MLRKRVEVLFDADKYALLEQVSKREGKSIGSLVREAVEQKYLDTEMKKRWEAFKRLTSKEFDFGDWDEIEGDLLRGYTEDLEEELGYKITE